MARNWKELLNNFAKFMVVSLIGTVVDLGLHSLLSVYVFQDNYWGSYWVAPAISFETSVIVGCVFAYFFIWKDRVSERSTRSFFRHLGGYNLANIGCFLIKFVLLQAFHFLFVHLNWLQSWELEPTFCNLLGSIFGGLFNFWINEFVIFNQKKEKQETTDN